MKEKGLSTILILIVIFTVAGGIIGGAYYLKGSNKIMPQNSVISKTSPTSPDETDTWKTYTNQVYRFSLKYPKEWREEVHGGNTVFLTPAPLTSADFQEERIAIEVVANTKHLSSREYLDQVAIPPQKGSACEGNIKVIPDIPESLKNSDVTIADGFCGIFDEGPAMYIAKGDIIVTLTSGFNQINNNNRNLVNRIYSTMKFYDQNQTIPLSSESRCIAEYRAIIDLIYKFETLQKEKDPAGVLALFTSPTSNAEIDSYNFLVGKKTGVIGLYGNVTTNFNETDYKIIGDPVQNQQACTISVEEQRSTYSNADPVGYQPAVTYKISFDVIKKDTAWMIDKYYTGQTPGKYSAWGY